MLTYGYLFMVTYVTLTYARLLLNTFYILAHLILMINLNDRYYLY